MVNRVNMKGFCRVKTMNGLLTNVFKFRTEFLRNV